MFLTDCPVSTLENINIVSSDILLFPVISIFLIISLNEKDENTKKFKRNDNKKLKSKKIDIDTLNNLNFKKINTKRYPMIRLLNLLPSKHSLFETVVVSANDTLVQLFLENKIKFTDIQKKLFNIINKRQFINYKNKSPKTIRDIVELNNYVRLKTLKNNI